MKVHIYPTKLKTGQAAGQHAARAILQALAVKGNANIILATGASQFEMMAELVAHEIDWSKVTAFHLDEYIGLTPGHPAGFQTYLKQRFEKHVRNLWKFNYVDGAAPDPAAECRRLKDIIGRITIDVACVGIGENGHLAFNDPPADFETDEPYIIVNLDDACRRQQLGEGWFAGIDDVPSRAISMSIRQIMKSECIVCTVPDRRKAAAVKSAIEEPVSRYCPASILQHHTDCTVYLDNDSASLLS